MNKKTDCSLFYEMEKNKDPDLDFVKSEIIKTMVSFEHFRNIKDYKSSDDLRKLLLDFNIQVQTDKENNVFYYSPELIWASLIRAINYANEQNAQTPPNHRN